MTLARSIIALVAILAATPAYAQAAGQQGAGGYSFFIMLALMFGVFYFLLIRPQQKRQKEHKAMIDAVRRGDIVVTSGGMIGKVTKVIDENEVQVELADNVRVRVIKSTLADVRGKGEPAAPAKGDKGDKKSKDDKTEASAANDEPANDKVPGGK
jgi:preprotein translocase subunit YajC